MGTEPTAGFDRHAAESDLHGDIILRNTFVVTVLGAVGFLSAIAYTMI